MFDADLEEGAEHVLCRQAYIDVDVTSLQLSCTIV